VKLKKRSAELFENENMELLKTLTPRALQEAMSCIAQEKS
jgi:hypothetical protein